VRHGLTGKLDAPGRPTRAQGGDGEPARQAEGSGSLPEQPVGGKVAESGMGGDVPEAVATPGGRRRRGAVLQHRGRAEVVSSARLSDRKKAGGGAHRGGGVGGGAQP
jgi:hypothetical protein